MRFKLVLEHSTRRGATRIARIKTLGLALLPAMVACSQSARNDGAGLSGSSGSWMAPNGGSAMISQGGSQATSSAVGGHGGSSVQGQVGGNTPGQGGGTNAEGGRGAGGEGALQYGGSDRGGKSSDGGAIGGSASEVGGIGPSGSTMMTGGASIGGASIGGASTGGASTGGASIGGASIGGVSTGGGNRPSGGTSATSGAGASAAAGSGDVEVPAVRFIGRMDRSDNAGPKFAWSGSGMVARFSGTTVSVKLNGGQEYTVVLDGVLKPKLVANNGINLVAQNLAAGTHTIELYRRTEANQGETQFLGFDFGGGSLLTPPAPATRRLEIVGDSISCGYGVEGVDQNCSFSADTENHYATYGAIAARELGAELITIAWSGKGVVCNYGDAADSCTNPLPTYYDRALPERANSQWDFSSFQPNAVVVNLGTNDLSTNQDPTQVEFENAYKAFLQHIRSKYPSAYLLCTNGSMLSGGELSTVRSYIGNVVKEMNDAGDAKVGSFDLTAQVASDGYGCDWHPSQATHQKMAIELEAALRKALGW